MGFFFFVLQSACFSHSYHHSISSNQRPRDDVTKYGGKARRDRGSSEETTVEVESLWKQNKALKLKNEPSRENTAPNQADRVETEVHAKANLLRK